MNEKGKYCFHYHISYRYHVAIEASSKDEALTMLRERWNVEPQDWPEESGISIYDDYDDFYWVDEETGEEL